MTDTECFHRDGYIGPVPLFTADECQRIARYEENSLKPPAVWAKGRAITNPFIHELAQHPVIVSTLTRLLGDGLVLFGSDFLIRDPRKVHPWHTDADAGSAGGLCVNVWVGVQNVCTASSLMLIAGTHRLGKTVQQTAHEHRIGRRERTTERVLEWAEQAASAPATLVRPDIHDGEAIFFDGRLWHASHNVSDHRRLALLLQYTSHETTVQIPDFRSLEWPFSFVGPAPTLPIGGAR